jgi:hypothetical protein
MTINKGLKVDALFSSVDVFHHLDEQMLQRAVALKVFCIPKLLVSIIGSAAYHSTAIASLLAGTFIVLI